MPDSNPAIEADLDKAVSQIANSGPRLFTWKQLGGNKQKHDIKVKGEPNKLKNFSSVDLKP